MLALGQLIAGTVDLEDPDATGYVAGGVDGDQRTFDLDSKGPIWWWEVMLIGGSVDAKWDVQWEDHQQGPSHLVGSVGVDWELR